MECVSKRSTKDDPEDIVVPQLQLKGSMKSRSLCSSSQNVTDQMISKRFVFVLFVCFCFLGPHSQHMEVPMLGVELGLQLLAYATATAVQDPSHVCDLHHSSQQRWIINPLSEARDQTCNLMVPSWIRFHCTMMGTPELVDKTLLMSLPGLVFKCLSS